MSKPMPIEPEKLKPVLHEKIERMNGEQLTLVSQVLLQVEAEELADRLNEALDQDREQGKLRRVSELVKQFRAEHRYA
jgi:tRNA A37 N6-isopentenylltransferase MiaA